MLTKRSMTIVLSLLCLFSQAQIAQESEVPFQIQLGTINIVLLSGAKAYPTNENQHLLIQFYEIPDARQRRGLKDRGIHLQRYVGGNAYLARVTTKDPSQIDRIGARAVLNYAPEMKLSRQFTQNKQLHMKVMRGERTPVYIRFHSDIPFDRAAQVLQSAWIIPDQKDYLYNHAVLAQADLRSLDLLLASDEVDFVDVGLPPRIVHNADTAALINVKDIRLKKKYKRPSGQGILVGVWDDGPIDFHTDLQGRITIIENDEQVSSHATHISGTIAGKGILRSKAKGMAVDAHLYSYDLYGDILVESSRAIQKYGVEIGNHSWGYIQGWYAEMADDWSYLEGIEFGEYHGETGAFDSFVVNYDFPFVKSAGNARDNSYLGMHSHDIDGKATFSDLHPPNPDFGALTILAVAKNSIVVGATTKDKILTAFSSTGPTQDGRVKPDIVAPGYNLFSTIRNNGYAKYSGTSMSAPVVTGVSALLMHYYKKLGGETLGALLLRALLIHSAEDLGNPGPDYLYGFGLVDAEFAARILKAASTSGNLAGVAFVKTSSEPSAIKKNLVAQVIQAELDNKDKLKYAFDVPVGAPQFRATLVWNDPWGKKLVNNLDLLVRDPQGKKVRPYVLNPNKPTVPAARKRNSRDNQEFILVENPKPGVWKVEVNGRKIPWGPQKYALVVSAGTGNKPSPTKNEGACEIDAIKAYHGRSPYSGDEHVGFTGGDKLAFNLTGRILANAKYNDYYGAVSVDIYMYNSSGELILKYKTTLTNLAPKYFSIWSMEYEIPSALSTGNYRIEALLTMHNGSTSQASTAISINQ